MSELDQTLRRLALSDEQTVRSVLDTGPAGLVSSGLDPKTFALARVAALLAVGSTASACQCSVEAARDAGASEEELVGLLAAIGPVVGLARVTAAAPTLGLAIGHDVEAAFENPDG